MVVRDRDAHAWAECFIDGQGWMTVDATPAAGLPDAIFPAPSKWRTWWEWFTDIPRRIRQWLAKASGVTLIVALFIIAAIPAFLWLFKKMFRRRAILGNSSEYLTPSQEFTSLARRFERWMVRQGRSCAPDRTWRENLSASSALPLSSAGLAFTDAYDSARFGEFDPSSIAQLTAQLDQLEIQSSQPGSTHHG